MLLIMKSIEAFSGRRKQNAAEKLQQYLHKPTDVAQANVTEIYNATNARVTLKERLSRARKQYDLFMYEHGRVIADTATEARRVGGVAETALILLDKPKVARAISIPVSATDLIDGYSARKHKDGATVEGGERDQKYDKQRSLMVELALVAKGRMDWKHLAIRVGSDMVMNKVIRPYYKDKGIDTKAGWAGKASSTSVTIAQFSAMGENNPQSIQNIATGAKVGRVGIYTAQWGMELWRKNRAEAKTELLVA
jgi:phosphatidylglycerophosphate synthase